MLILSTEEHEYWMNKAISLANQAQLDGEVPVGALLIYQNELIASARNASIGMMDPTAHAEILVLRQAAQYFGNYRLPYHSTLYVTLEPCAMCLGGMLHARVGTLVYGAKEDKSGAVCSACNLLEFPLAMHKMQVVSGVLAEKSVELMRAFFQEKRQQAKLKKKNV